MPSRLPEIGGLGIARTANRLREDNRLRRFAFPILRFAINQDPLACAFKIVELPAGQRPNEGSQAAQSQQQRDRDKDGNPGHRAHRVRRSALATTMMEEVDIAIAAISGVTSPNSASGTARIL